MAGISWWAWLGVGLFVAISSSYVGGKLQLFAWVGLLFVAIGIAKAVYLFVIAPREEKKEAAKPVPIQQTQHFYCPRCRFAVHAYDFFCRRCGARLR